MSFTPWPEHPFTRRLEREGHALRTRLKLTSFDALDPSTLITTFDEMRATDLIGLFGANHPGMRVLFDHRRAWSAIAYREQPEPWLIVTNPWHAETRQRASAMEEVAHIVLKHKPTRLDPCPHTGLPKRTFTASKEKEAYGVAGAALVPFTGLVTLLRDGESAEEIAIRYGVSVELANMRINVTRARKAA